MAGIARVHGAPLAGAFYGLQPLVVKIATTNLLTADTGGGATEITEGGRTKAVRALQTVGSIVWLSAADAGVDNLTAVVDGATVNNGAGLVTAGTWGALKDALAAAVGGVPGDFTVTSSSVLNADGSFTFA